MTTHLTPKNPTRRTMARLLIPLVAFALLAACGSSSPSKSAATTTSTTTASASSSASTASSSKSEAITIQGFAFNPKSVTIKAGTTVTWTNKDTATHTATSDNGAFATPDIKPGTSESHTFTKPGTYTYHCSIHPTMTATIIVT